MTTESIASKIWFLKPFCCMFSIVKRVFNKWTIITLLVVSLICAVIDETRNMFIAFVKSSYGVLSAVDWLGIWARVYAFAKWLYPYLLQLVQVGKNNMYAVYILGIATAFVILLQLIWLAILRFSPSFVKYIQRKAAWFGIRSGLGALAIAFIIAFPLPYIDPNIAIVIRSFALFYTYEAWNVIRALFERFLFSGNFDIHKFAYEAAKRAQEVEANAD